MHTKRHFYGRAWTVLLVLVMLICVSGATAATRDDSPPPDCAIDPDTGQCIVPTVSVSVSPTSIPADGQATATVSWSSTNATSCSATWTSSTAPNGSWPVGPFWTAGNYTYTITCYLSGASVTGGVTLNVTAPPPPPPTPSVALSAYPTSITAGDTSTLTWSSTNASSCSGNWSGSIATSGQAYVAPPATTTYSVTCSGSGGSASASATVNVTAPPPPPPGAPTVSLTANPTGITAGGSATLSWSSTNASSCSAAWTASTATSGSATVSPSVTTGYSITCSGAGGSASASATVTVSASTVPKPTVSLTANPTGITAGGSATLSWSSTNAKTCSDSWTASTATSGSQQVSPTADTTYTRTCSGDGGTTASLPVTVKVSAVVDADGDGIPDNRDNCGGTAAGQPAQFLLANPDQADSDGNGIGDRCDFAWGSDGVGDGSASGTLTTAGGLSGGCNGSFTNRIYWATNDKVRYRQRLTGITLWGYMAAVSVCINPINHKIVAWGSHTQDACCVNGWFWSYDNHPNWDLDNIGYGGSRSVWAKVTDSLTGCPVINIGGLGCKHVSVTVVFNISGYATYTSSASFN